MKIFDCHFHISAKDNLTPLKVEGRNIIFNSFEDYDKHKKNVKSSDSISLIFDFKSEKNLSRLKKLHDNKKINALKIHSRIQKIDNKSFKELMDKLLEFNPQVPIIYDAFYYGDDIEYKPDLKNLIELAKTFPTSPIILAHCGGYEVLKYFFHLRQLKNIFYDLSLSLQLLSDSSVFLDFIKLIKFTDKTRILFGSDYPYAEPALQFQILTEICVNLNLTQKEINQIVYSNSIKLFNPNK